MKNILCKYLAFVFIALALPTYAKQLQIWQNENLIYKIDNQFSIGFQYETRMNVVDYCKVLENHFTPSMTWKAIDWLSISPNYRYVLLKRDHHFIKDNRPGIDFILSYKLSDFLLSNRSRFILRHSEGDSSYFRYRNMSKLQYNGIDWLFSPYVSYEMFFDNSSHNVKRDIGDKITSHWTSIGISKKLIDNFKIDIAYMIIYNKNIESYKKPCNVINFGFNFLF